MNTQTMTKRERRQIQLDRHYAALVRLAKACGSTKADGKKMSVALLKLEQEAHKGAEDYCNGVRFNDDNSDRDWQAFEDDIEARVTKIIGAEVPGFFVNGDARGYALKINDKAMRDGSIVGTESRYKGVGLQTDWGGYGLLAPMIDGN